MDDPREDRIGQHALDLDGGIDAAHGFNDSIATVFVHAGQGGSHARQRIDGGRSPIGEGVGSGHRACWITETGHEILERAGGALHPAPNAFRLRGPGLLTRNAWVGFPEVRSDVGDGAKRRVAAKAASLGGFGVAQ